MGNDYVPFYCDYRDRIVRAPRDEWRFCPLCGKKLTEPLRLELESRPEPAPAPPVPHGFNG